MPVHFRDWSINRVQKHGFLDSPEGIQACGVQRKSKSVLLARSFGCVIDRAEGEQDRGCLFTRPLNM